MRRRTSVTLALTLVVASAPSLAHAYVRSRTSSGTPLLWNGACAEMELSSVDNPDYSAERLHAAFDAAVESWEAQLDGCAPLNITLAGATTAKQNVGYDGTNLVRWRLPHACEDPSQASSELCRSPNAAAITTVFYVDRPGDPRDGELLETDLELNAANFAFADDGDPTHMDMQNTLSHELGHIMGLDHSCFTLRGGAPPIDSNNDLVPYCFPLSSLPASVTQATMFNFADPGETTKRVPGADEVHAVCELYATRPATCKVEEMPGCGCQLGDGPTSFVTGTVTFLIAAFLWPWRRRHRPKHRSPS